MIATISYVNQVFILIGNGTDLLLHLCDNSLPALPLHLHSSRLFVFDLIFANDHLPIVVLKQQTCRLFMATLLLSRRLSGFFDGVLRYVLMEQVKHDVLVVDCRSLLLFERESG